MATAFEYNILAWLEYILYEKKKQFLIKITIWNVFVSCLWNMPLFKY